MQAVSVKHSGERGKRIAVHSMQCYRVRTHWEGGREGGRTEAMKERREGEQKAVRKEGNRVNTPKRSA